MFLTFHIRKQYFGLCEIHLISAQNRDASRYLCSSVDDYLDVVHVRVGYVYGNTGAVTTAVREEVPKCNVGWLRGSDHRIEPRRYAGKLADVLLAVRPRMRVKPITEVRSFFQPDAHTEPRRCCDSNPNMEQAATKQRDVGASEVASRSNFDPASCAKFPRGRVERRDQRLRRGRSPGGVVHRRA